jgi:hypothetical protein
MTLAGEGVVLTALRPNEARVANETPDARTVRLGNQTLELRPWEIRTTTTP